VSLLTRTIVIAFVLSACVIDVGAKPNQPVASASVLPMLLTTMGHTQIVLHDIQPDNHMTLEICSSDVTAMPSRSTLRMSFDASITHLNEFRAPVPLQIETAVGSHQVTFVLARDPFAAPQPWSYRITLGFNQLPRTGIMTLGNLPPEQVAFPSPRPSVPTRTLSDT
jgi:hypothetical protein